MNSLSSLDIDILKKFNKYSKRNVKKIKKGYPLQYIIKNTEFYGYSFKVNRNVLIPRFETELLVQKLVDYIKTYNFESSSVIDIGTGSGCIAITLKKEVPTLNIEAIDKSKKSLKVALENAKINNTNISFINKDIFKYNFKKKYDVIISNPPYIEINSNYNKNILFEPKEAIFVSNEEPLKYYDRILKLAKDNIYNKYLIAFEIDENHGNDLKKLAKDYFPQSKITIEKDFANKDRFMFIMNK